MFEETEYNKTGCLSYNLLASRAGIMFGLWEHASSHVLELSGTVILSFNFAAPSNWESCAGSVGF